MSDHPLPLPQVRRGTAQGPGLLGRVRGGGSGWSGGHGEAMAPHPGTHLSMGRGCRRSAVRTVSWW